MTKAPKADDPVRHVRAISEDRINLSRSVRNEWIVRVPAGTLPEDLTQPEYWKHVVQAKRFKAGDDIIARCEDRTWRASYEIRDVGPLHATLAILKPDSAGVCWFAKIDELAKDSDTHYVEWLNIGTMYVVKRKSDGEIIEQKFRTPELAAAWMHKHIEKIAD